MRLLPIVLVAAASMLLSACGILDALDDETYRFRMAVVVDTPTGLKTGTSVYEISAGKRWQILPDARSRAVSIKGEAVAVDVAPGKTLFALLKTHAHFESMMGLSMETLDPQFTKDYDVVATAGRLAARDGNDPPVEVAPDNYPMLVTFADPGDPTSVALVDPDDLAATFGEGMSLKRITVEVTHDPVTNGIEKRLGAFGVEEGHGLDRTRGVTPNPTLAQQLGFGDFVRR